MLSSLVARSLMVSMNWVAHDLFFMKPCWKYMGLFKELHGVAVQYVFNGLAAN